MKPIISFVYNSIDSPKDASKIEQNFRELIELELSEERYSSIIDSSLQLYITVIVNPENKALEVAYHQNDFVYVRVAPSIEKEDGVYSLQLGLCRIKPQSNLKSLVVISNKPVTRKEEDMPSNVSFTYIAVKPQWTFDSIVLSQNVKNRLIRATKIIKNKNIIYEELGYSLIDKTLKSIICFHGPAGTGKTITAQAIAHYLGKNIVISSYAQIESKYVGEGAKNLRKIFKDAQEQDAVLFMDECDSFLSKRIEHTEGGSDKHYNRMSNELFQLLEDYSGCIIFATNLLTDIDNAFKSRIVDSIYFPLPDKECRKLMLQKMVLPNIYKSISRKEEEFDEFIDSIDGFSGRDMRKSILLSFADILDEYVQTGNENFEWNIEKFRKGFDDVRSSFSENPNASQIPTDELQKFLEQKRFKQKQFELAKHAIISDDNIDDRGYELLNELSLQLLNCEFDKKNIMPTMTIAEICDGIIELASKHILIKTVIRVIAIDGKISDNERTFIKRMCDLLNFSNQENDNFIKYAESIAAANSIWQVAVNQIQ